MKTKVNKRLWRADRVAAWRLCMGCGACMWACPRGAVSLHDIVDKGIRPFVDEPLCERCGRCVAVCPGILLEHGIFPSGCIDTLRESWGPVLQIWEGFASDSGIRFKASSGGLATAIALWALEEGDFAGILHIKPDPDNPLRNIPAVSRTRDDVIQAIGSRYAPAAPCQAFDWIKESEGPCIFIGKPCDCAALQKASKLDPGLASRVGLVISIFCAGTPAASGTLEILQEMGIEDPGQVKSFRYRGNGWPGETRAEVKSMLFADDEKKDNLYTMTYEQSWGGILTKHGQLRCRLCPDKTGEFSDIALGDSWYRAREGNPGHSLVLLRSPIGLSFWQKLRISGYLESETSLWNRLPESQNSLHQGRRSLYGRLTAFRLTGTPVPVYQGFSLIKDWQKLGIFEKIKAAAGTLRRIIQRKWYKPDNTINSSNKQ